MNWKQFRDLSVTDDWVLACDSIGGIGEKPGDVLCVNPSTAGYYLARVPILECLCYGAMPFGYTALISNERFPTGEGILQGIEEAFSEIEANLLLRNGSTEENMKTSMTAAGITVLAKKQGRGYRKPKVGEELCFLGLPLVGQEVLQAKWKLPLLDVLALRQERSISDILPVGSRGIRYEVAQMEQCAGLTLSWNSSDEDFLRRSAGPASCLLVSVESQGKIRLEKSGIPWGVLGHWIKKTP